MKEFLASIGKHKFIMAALLAVGAALIVIGTASSGGGSETADARSEYERSLEKRLTELCLSVDGIDDATVLVTATEAAEGASRYYAAQSAVLTVRGVAAVVTRGDDPEVKRTLTELICASLGIPSNRVSVAPRK